MSTSYLDRLASQNDEAFSTLGQKAHELLGEDLLKLISLLDADTNAHRVDGTLNENLLLLVTSNNDRVEQELFVGAEKRKLGLGSANCRTRKATGKQERWTEM